MRNYSKNTALSQAREESTGLSNTLLKIASNSDISDIFGDLVPYPHSHYFDHSINRMVYAWYIDGFFDTSKNVRYLNDIIARFKISCDCKLHSFKKSNNENIKPCKLKEFQGLKSLAKEQLKHTLQVNSLIRGDYVFTCIVLQAEKYIKTNGLIDYSVLESWAFDNFIDIAKDKGTLKAKCNNCWNWYFDRDWKLFHTVRIKKDVEEVMATRVEHAIRLGKNKEKENIAKIKNAITGLMADAMFKKKNGTWNGKSIAQYLNLDERTVSKYLKSL